MEWFKHMTNARHDAKLVELRAKLGMKGYGQFWVLLEIIAQEMDMLDSGKCDVKIDRHYLARELQVRVKKLDRLLRSCSDVVQHLPDNSSRLVHLKCEKLLKIRARKKPNGCNPCRQREEGRIPPISPLPKSRASLTSQREQRPGVANAPPLLLPSSDQKRNMIAEYFKRKGRASWTNDEARDAWEEIKISKSSQTNDLDPQQPDGRKNLDRAMATTLPAQ